MDQVQTDQGIDKAEWGLWDVQTIADKEAAKYHFDFANMSNETESVISETTDIYDITSDMVIDYDLDLDSMNEKSVNEIPALPDIDTLRAELNVLGGNESPPADFVMPENYYPASPTYSPVIINIDTDTESEHG